MGGAIVDFSQNNEIHYYTVDLPDYKFFCFNGEPKYCQVISGRGSKMCIDFFDRDWTLQPFTYNHPNSGGVICKPDNLGELIEKAELLARGFPHVRVDFYRLNTGKLYFGEMTFTSFSGICQWDPPETDLMLDLNADSLDAVDVLTQIEDEFGIEIPDEMTEEFNIVANLVKYVEEHTQK